MFMRDSDYAMPDLSAQRSKPTGQITVPPTFCQKKQTCWINKNARDATLAPTYDYGGHCEVLGKV